MLVGLHKLASYHFKGSSFCYVINKFSVIFQFTRIPQSSRAFLQFSSSSSASCIFTFFSFAKLCSHDLFPSGLVSPSQLISLFIFHVESKIIFVCTDEAPVQLSLFLVLAFCSVSRFHKFLLPITAHFGE